MLLHLSDSILLSKNTRSISVQKRWDWNKEKKKKKRGNAFHEKEKNIVVLSDTNTTKTIQEVHLTNFALERYINRTKNKQCRNGCC